MRPGLTLCKGFVHIERQLGEKELRQLANQRDTKVLRLDHLELPDLSFLEALEALEQLNLYVVRAGKYGALKRLKKLRKLFISGPKEADLSYLSAVTRVEDLSILWARQLTCLPDLARCRKLTHVLLWNCKRLADITALTAIPNLETVRIVNLALTEPQDYEPLLCAPQIQYLAVQLKSAKRNAEFDRLLAKHGKRRHPPLAEPH